MEISSTLQQGCINYYNRPEQCGFQQNKQIIMRQSFRRSRILDHNIHHQTDQLYNPLRETLIESSRSKHKQNRLTRAASLYDLRGSEVSKRLWQLSPQQADYLTKSIYIPTDQLLRPTRDLSQVAGKKFVAINMKVKQNGTISQEQFMRRLHGNDYKSHEVVYRVQQQYGYPNNVTDTPIKTIQSNFNHKRDDYQTNRKSRLSIESIQAGNSRISQSGKKKLSLTTSKQQSTLKIQNPMNQNEINTQMQGSTNEYGINNIKLGSKPTTNLDQCQSQQITHHSSTQGLATPYFQSNLSSSHNQSQMYRNHQYLLNPMTGRASAPIQDIQNNFGQKSNQEAMRPLSHDNYFKLNQNSQLKQSSVQKLEQFNQLNSTNHDSIINGSGQKQKNRYGKSKSNYKYNFFSAMDYPINNSCRGCGLNQIIATKAQPPWS